MNRHSSTFNKQPATKRTVVSRTNEKKVDKLMKDIELLDESCKAVLKDCQKLMDSYTFALRAEWDIVHGLMNYSGEPNFKKRLSMWADRVTDKETSFQNMRQVLDKGMSEPMKKFSSFLPSVYSANKKREQALQEVYRLQAKVEKLENKERTGQNIVRLSECKKALISAREKFEQLNTMLLDDIPKLYESRLELMRPALQAVIHGHSTLYQSLSEAGAGVAGAFSEDVDMLLTASTPEEHLQNRLAEITALPIVVDSTHISSNQTPSVSDQGLSSVVDQ